MGMALLLASLAASVCTVTAFNSTPPSGVLRDSGSAAAAPSAVRMGIQQDESVRELLSTRHKLLCVSSAPLCKRSLHVFGLAH